MKFKKFNFILYASLFFFVIVGCQKNKSEGELTTDPNLVALKPSISLKEIEEIPIQQLKTLASGKISTPTGNKNIQTFDAFDAIQYSGVSQTEIANKKLLAATNGVPYAPVKIKEGTKYWLYLYTKTGPTTYTYYNHKLMTASAATADDATQQIPVVKGNTYKWYAYSYNSTESPTEATRAEGILTLPSFENKELVYATGEIAVTEVGVTPLDITLLQQMGRISLEFDARGMFTDNIKKLDVDVTTDIATTPLTLKKGVYNLLTGEFNTATVTDYNPPITLLMESGTSNQAFVTFDENYNDRKIAYFYSAPSTTLLPAMRVKLKNLTILIDDNSDRVFTNLNTEFNYTNLSINKGKNHSVKIDLLESPLQVTGVANDLLYVGTGTRVVKWARQNIYFKGSGTRNPYRFHHRYVFQGSKDYKSMFAFLADEPAQYRSQTGFATNGGDPCLKVYPAGVWISAKTEDWKSLGQADRTLSGLQFVQNSTSNSPARNNSFTHYTNGTDGTLTNLHYWEFNTQSPVPQAGTYPSNKLRFNANGYIGEVGVLIDIVNLSFSNSSYGTSAYYWAQDNLVDLLGLASVGEAYSYFTINNGFNKLSHNYNLSSSLLGLAVLRSNFYNVRCVRAQ